MSAYRRHVVASVALSALVRLRFVFAPLTDDEGVASTAARVWARGGVPYRDVWLDRPQGAMVLHRLVPPQSIRWVTVVAAAVLVVAVASASRSIARAVAARRSDLVPAPDRVGAIAAVVTAVVSVTPSWMGYAAGPVLIGLAFAATALALSVLTVAGRVGGWAALTAGGCAGVAISLDLFAAAATMVVPLWLGVAAVTGRRRAVSVSVVRLVGIGAVAVVVPLAVHLLRIGPSPWWQAVVVARLRRDDPQQWLLLVPVLATLAGLWIGRLRLASWRAVAVAVALVPSAWSFGGEVFRSDAHLATHGVGRGAAHAEPVARWIAANSSPVDRVYAMCSGAAMYAEADRLPAMAYLTGSDLRRAGVTPTSVVSLLSGDDRPEWVAVFDLPAECGSPSLVEVLATHYREAAVVDGVTVLRAVRP